MANHQNIKSITDYYRRIDAGETPTHAGYRMTPDDVIRREVIMRIMCDNEVMKANVSGKFGIDFDTYFAASLPKLEKFTGDGLLELRPDRIVISPPGRLIVRNIAMCFDPYLEVMQKERPIFSKTV